MPASARPCPSAWAAERYAGSLPEREPQNTATEFISDMGWLWPGTRRLVTGIRAGSGILMTRGVNAPDPPPPREGGLGGDLAGAHQPARCSAGILALLEDRCAGYEGRDVAVDALHQPPAAGRQVVADLRHVQA